MNLPNKLTVVRIVLTPFFLAAMLLKLNYNINYLIAAVIFIAASVTDFRIVLRNSTFCQCCCRCTDTHNHHQKHCRNLFDCPLDRKSTRLNSSH